MAEDTPRIKWMRQWIDSGRVRELKPAACKLMMVVAVKFADEAGLFWPAMDTLVEASGMAERSVKRAMAELVEAGVVLQRRRAAPGMTAKYQLCGCPKVDPNAGQMGPALQETKNATGANRGTRRGGVAKERGPSTARDGTESATNVGQNVQQRGPKTAGTWATGGPLNTPEHPKNNPPTPRGPGTGVASDKAGEDAQARGVGESVMGEPVVPTGEGIRGMLAKAGMKPAAIDEAVMVPGLTASVAQRVIGEAKMDPSVKSLPAVLPHRLGQAAAEALAAVEQERMQREAEAKRRQAEARERRASDAYKAEYELAKQEVMAMNETDQAGLLARALRAMEEQGANTRFWRKATAFVQRRLIVERFMLEQKEAAEVAA